MIGHGAIGAGDEITAAVGAQILKQGGNAVDAAVAAAFASFISEIGVVHLGGSGMAQIYDPVSGRGVVYDFFSNMPGTGAAVLPPERDDLDFTKVTIDFIATTQDFYVGRGSVAVPGNIYGLCRMVADYGRLSLSDVLQPAIDMARDGIAVCDFQANTCKLLYDLYTYAPSMREVFMPHGRFIEGGDRLYIPYLVRTLEALAAEGEALQRSGRLAEAMVSDQREKGGLVTEQDLADYEVFTHEPIRIAYRDCEILLPRPSSSGGILTAFTLKLLNRFNMEGMTHGSANHLQLLCEAMAVTTQARRHWDLARKHLSLEEAVKRFLHDEFVADFATEVMMSIMKGRPSRVVDEPVGRTNTSHISVVDGEGMAVSLTTTAGESAGYIVPETGYIPNNMLGEEDLHPDGFHTTPPGERIFTMMTPTVVLKDGRIKLVVGSGGSIRIRSAIMQTISNVVDFELPLDEAINRPRVHLEHKVLQCEVGYDPAAVRELESLGYRVNRWQNPSMYFGGAHSVGLVNGKLVGGGDRRRNGTAA